MIENNAELPKGWVMTSVGEIYDILGGGTPSTSIPEYWNGHIPWITSADIVGLKEITPRKLVSKQGVENSATHVVPEKSLIVVTRVGLGKIGLTNVPLCFSQDCQALVGNDNLIHPEYALYFLSTAVNIFKYKNRGTTISGVTKKQLNELSFPLPPFNEQVRIASKVEELFSFLDAGVASLRAVQVQLKRYRQAVLKAAFEGKLTQQWRLVNKEKLESRENIVDRVRAAKTSTLGTKFKEPPKLAIESLPVIPSEWCWQNFSLVIKKVKRGPSLKCNQNAKGIRILLQEIYKREK